MAGTVALHVFLFSLYILSEGSTNGSQVWHDCKEVDQGVFTAAVLFLCGITCSILLPAEEIWTTTLKIHVTLLCLDTDIAD